MLTVLGILLLTGGAILTFAVEREAEGVDLQLVGWILMAGGGASLIAAILRGALVGPADRLGLPAATRQEDRRAA